MLTNKCQQGAYRGFGSEATNFVLERMVDAAAEELEMDPAEIRRKNFIQPDQFPYKIPTGNVYDSGNYEAVLDKALKMVDYEGWRKRQEEAGAKGGTSASGWSPARSAASSAPPSSGSGTMSPGLPSPTRRRA